MVDLLLLPPFVFLVGAFLVAIAPAPLRSPLLLLTPLAGLAAIGLIPEGAQVSTYFLGYEIALIEGSGLRRLFATAFAIMAFSASLFSVKGARVLEMVAGLGLAGGAIGVAFAGDLTAMFLFWEVMALSATVLVWSGGRASAQSAGVRYITLHLLRGLLLKVGIEQTMVGTGSIAVRPLTLEDPVSWFLLAAILVSAAAPPVSFWVSDAYPESSPRSNVWLSAFTTTTGILALLLLFPGESALMWIGVWMIFYGILYAVRENDVRKALSYSIVTQAGFMVCAIGIGTEMALNGAAALAITSMFAMGLLFMSAASVEEVTGERRYSALGGLFRRMPLTAICGTVGALAISALPLTSGFVALPLARTGLGESSLTAVTALLLLGSGGVVLQLGLRFPWLLFFRGETPSGAADPGWNMRAAMVLLAAICLGIGVLPGFLYAGLPFPMDYSPFGIGALLTQLLVLAIGGAVALYLLPKVRPIDGVRWDWDWSYRRLGRGLAEGAIARGVGVSRWFHEGPGSQVRRLLRRFSRSYGPQGSLARSWPSGSMVLWVGVILGAYLVFALF